MTLLVLLAGCAGGGDASDSAPMETAAPDPCVGGDAPGQTLVGTADCDSDGHCAVPSGEFWMGGTDYADECPARKVTLSAYHIDRLEVTQAKYDACVAAGACTVASPGCLGADVGSDLPQICVNWQQSSDFCAWSGGRLPTEAEWERAARGDDGVVWPWGEVPPDCNDANFRYVAAYCHLGVMPVGSFPGVTAYGLSDTVGNAWEWISDWYDATYYQTSPTTDPTGPDEDACHEDVGRDATACLFRGIRGGAYNTTEQTTRGQARSGAHPDVIDDNIGFRCAYPD